MRLSCRVLVQYCCDLNDLVPFRLLPFRLLPFRLLPFRLFPFRLLPFRLLWLFNEFPFRLLCTFCQQTHIFLFQSYCNLFLFYHIYVPPTEGGGHIVFGAVPVGVGVGVRVGVRVRVASFLRDIF